MAIGEHVGSSLSQTTLTLGHNKVDTTTWILQAELYTDLESEIINTKKSHEMTME